jgi:hypothetical protein
MALSKSRFATRIRLALVRIVGEVGSVGLQLVEQLGKGRIDALVMRQSA